MIVTEAQFHAFSSSIQLHTAAARPDEFSAQPISRAIGLSVTPHNTDDFAFDADVFGVLDQRIVVPVVRLKGDGRPVRVVPLDSVLFSAGDVCDDHVSALGTVGLIHDDDVVCHDAGIDH